MGDGRVAADIRLPDVCRDDVFFSYKSGDYFAAGLPMINSLTVVLKRLLDTHNCGEYYVAGNRGSLERAI